MTNLTVNNAIGMAGENPINTPCEKYIGKCFNASFFVTCGSFGKIYEDFGRTNVNSVETCKDLGNTNENFGKTCENFGKIYNVYICNTK